VRRRAAGTAILWKTGSGNGRDLQFVRGVGAAHCAGGGSAGGAALRVPGNSACPANAGAGAYPTALRGLHTGDFDTNYPGADKSLQSAVVQARGFVKGYPVETDGTGLLLVGPAGVGKTHIAVGILKDLVARAWGARTLLRLS